MYKLTASEKRAAGVFRIDFSDFIEAFSITSDLLLFTYMRLTYNAMFTFQANTVLTVHCKLFSKLSLKNNKMSDCMVTN